MRLWQLLSEHRADLLHQWTASLQANARPTAMSPRTLLDHLPDFIDDLIVALRAAAGVASDDSPASLPGESPISRVHGAQRLRAGISAAQLVEEYGLLHAVIVRFSHAHAVQRTLAEEEVLALSIARASMEAVTQYTDDRDQEQGLILGVLGHDLRSPLTTLRLAADTLIRRADLPDSVIKVLLRTFRSMNRMERLTGDLVDFARERRGFGMPILPAPMNLDEVCRVVVDDAEAQHADRAITLDARPRLACVLDRDRITQALQNLVGNALEHGGTSPVHVRAATEDAHVTVEVHNGGPPIPAALLPVLFDPFTRGDHTARSRSVGLGLYITQAIVRAHGGTLTVESTAEAGTTFRLSLPREVAAANVDLSR